MKILIVCDTPEWAIDRLVQAAVKYNTQHNIKVIYIPPRGVAEKRDEFIQLVKDFKPDLIEYDYFRTAGQLLEDQEIFDLTKNTPSILVHHNQKDKAIWMYDFEKLGIKKIVHHNKRGMELHIEKFGPCEKLVKIPLVTDLNEFQYRENTPEERFFGYAGRILRWKNLDKIIEATKAIGEKVMIMGREDDVAYQAEIGDTHGFGNVSWDYWTCTDPERKEYYKSLFAYIGFSRDGTETGTLELLEAMASGVPVITTPTGIAEEIIQDGVNGLVVDFDDVEGLQEAMQRLIDDPELYNTLRKNAWNTVRGYDEPRYAAKFNTLWHEVAFPDEELVSVIIPSTTSKKENVEKIILSLEEQSYANIEVIVCWDDIERIDFAPKTSIPLKQVYTGREGYNLAMARNMGVCESDGKILMFCDNRMKPEPDAILSFVTAISHSTAVTFGGNKKVWFFGNKGSSKRAFVENFSAVRREQFIHFGMFLERITEYGGMSQEVRSRWKKQGGDFVYVHEAEATEINSSKMTLDRRNEINRMKHLIYKLYSGEKI